MNLLANAIDALDEYLTSPAGEGCSAPTVRIETALTAEQTVAIEIIDNGPGIPEAVRSKLFDPFFTTKPVGKGTGLGLSISHEIIVEKHGGTIECFSGPEEGTRFSIRIPCKQRGLEAAASGNKSSEHDRTVQRKPLTRPQSATA